MQIVIRENMAMFQSRFGTGRASRTGFTLVELLVVIAIIGTLVGLLLPAVQQARETARRSSCGNNTKQVALAVLNFESVRKRLPSTNANNDMPGTTSGNLASWIVFVLPYLEEKSLYDACVTHFKAPTNGAPWDAGATSPFIKQPPGLVCPSDPNARPSSAITNGYGVTSYRCSKGDMWGQWNQGIRGPFADSRVPGNNSAYQYVQLNKILDGTSKTFLLGEGVVGTLTNDVKSGLAVGVGIQPNTAATTCSAKAAGGALTGTTASTAGQGPGHRWGDWRDVCENVYTKIPPNGVACSDSSNPESTAAIPPSSWHPGGVNMAMCDGSVRFFTDEIDAGDQTATPPWPSSQTITYASYYGVWGALGSIQGGETKTVSD